MWRGDDWLYGMRWEQLMSMRQQIDQVEIVSWNDVSSLTPLPYHPTRLTILRILVLPVRRVFLCRPNRRRHAHRGEGLGHAVL
jgi:hypothetical protein